jgi:hypothetical protein
MLENIKNARNYTKEEIQELAKDGKSWGDIPKVVDEGARL